MYPAAHTPPFNTAHETRQHGQPSAELGASGHVRNSRSHVAPISVYAMPGVTVVAKKGATDQLALQRNPLAPLAGVGWTPLSCLCDAGA